MEKFIKHLEHKIEVIRTKVKDIHLFLKNTTEGKMFTVWKIEDRSLYTMFFGWLLENMLYGLLLTISLLTFGVKLKWYYPFTLASLYWLSIDSVNKISKAIRRK